MTLDDYETVAAAVHRSTMACRVGRRSQKEQAAMDAALRLVATDLAASLAHADPRLDQDAFLRACGHA